MAPCESEGFALSRDHTQLDRHRAGETNEQRKDMEELGNKDGQEEGDRRKGREMENSG